MWLSLSLEHFNLFVIQTQSTNLVQQKQEVSWQTHTFAKLKAFVEFKSLVQLCKYAMEKNINLKVKYTIG